MKTHWKKLDNPNYLGAYSLMDGELKEVTLTISKVVLEEVKTDRGSESCKVMYFKEKSKPMILNATNSKTIEKIYNTPYIEDWAGKSITIFVAKIKAFGEQIDCLRIRTKQPKQKILPELTINHEKYNSVVKALESGNYTIDDMKKHYTISEDLEQELSKLI